jgi:hypothetical protein
MLDQIAKAIARADGGDVRTDADRYRRLASTALKPLTKPTEAMIDAAHEAVWFDAYWAINSRADFRKAVRAMVLAAMNDTDGAARRIEARVGGVSRREQGDDLWTKGSATLRNPVRRKGNLRQGIAAACPGCKDGDNWRLSR